MGVAPMLVPSEDCHQHSVGMTAEAVTNSDAAVAIATFLSATRPPPWLCHALQVAGCEPRGWHVGKEQTRHSDLGCG